jgi:3-phenylpropionate/cinnamic acid dioxygenase small subunit
MSDADVIVAVLNRYAEACDRRHWELFDTVFAADAEVTYAGGTFTGVPAVVAYVRSKLDGCGPTQHLLGNYRIEVDGDTARAECALRAWHAGADDLAGLTFEALGSYHDELRRTGDSWLITRRRLEVVASFGSSAVLRSRAQP